MITEKKRASNKKWSMANRDKCREASRSYYWKNRDRVSETSRAYYQRNKNKCCEISSAWLKEHPEINRERARRHRLSFPEKVREYKIKYREKNQDKLREYQRQWRANNHFKCALRGRIKSFLKRRNTIKHSNSISLIGCPLGFLCNHLEEQFLPGMTWDNYGTAWHVDHVVPLSWFPVEDEEWARVAFHWTNLQPLWATENIRKGNRYAA